MMRIPITGTKKNLKISAIVSKISGTVFYGTNYKATEPNFSLKK